jgi:nucleotide-binding universal stress UspA family protein
MSDVTGAVVVGYDGSAEADMAVDWAAVEAVRRDRPLLVLFASDYDRLRVSPEFLDAWSPASVEEAAEGIVKAGEARARAAAPDVVVQVRTSHRGAASALKDLSEHAAIIVVGGRRHGRVTGVLLGSVAFATAAHAHCPVVVVPADRATPPGPQHPVVVGVDGSPGSDKAVEMAAELAAGTGAELVVASAWDTPAMDHWSRIYLADDEWRHQSIATARNGGMERVAHARELVAERYPDLVVRELVREGRADLLLADASSEAGLVAVGARGHGDLVSLLLGSTSRSVMHRAHCPVAIVR